MSVRNFPLADDVAFAPVGLSISDLAAAYRHGQVTVTEVVEAVLLRIDERGDDGTWITVADRFDLLAQAASSNPTRVPRACRSMASRSA